MVLKCEEQEGPGLGGAEEEVSSSAGGSALQDRPRVKTKKANTAKDLPAMTADAKLRDVENQAASLLGVLALSGRSCPFLSRRLSCAPELSNLTWRRRQFDHLIVT